MPLFRTPASARSRQPATPGRDGTARDREPGSGRRPETRIVRVAQVSMQAAASSGVPPPFWAGRAPRRARSRRPLARPDGPRLQAWPAVVAFASRGVAWRFPFPSAAAVPATEDDAAPLME